MNAVGMTRRDFLRASGGIVLFFSCVPLGVGATCTAKLPSVGSLQKYRALDAWLRIGTDGTVTVFTGKVEIGQGILTVIAQIAADELDIDLSRIRVVSGDTSNCPDEGWTAGSLSVEESGLAVRHAAAEARHVLLELAASSWQVAVESLRVDDGSILGPSDRQVTYWTLAAENPLRRDATLAIEPKRRDQRRLTGTTVARIDLPGKFTGVPSFIQDLKIPGMVHGRVVRPPSPGARLLELDESPARALPGVLAVVRDGSFIGAVAQREEQAVAASAALAGGAKWTDDPGWPLRMKLLPDQLRALPHRTIDLAAATATKPAAKRLAATYSRPFVAHASIGPSAAIGLASPEALTIWTHSQAVFPLQRALAKVLQLPIDRVHVQHAQGAGCYGHNGQDDVALDAALLARSVPGRPVRVQWMREDEFAWEPFGSAMLMQVGCELDDDGMVSMWNYDFWTGGHAERADIPPGQPNLLAAQHLATSHARPDEAFEVPLPAGGGSRNALPYYAFPARVTAHVVSRMPIRTSSLRGLGAYPNVFAIESMMDEAAAAAAVDPIEFRLRHLRDERAIQVLRAAAEAADWRGPIGAERDHGRGVAFSRYKNTKAYVAMVADVHVDRESGRIHVTNVTVAVDAGEVINPDGLESQIEGGVIQALSWTLKEEVRFDECRITSLSWIRYPILHFSEIPTIKVVMIERPGDGPLGAGEPSVPPVGAAVANAVAAATGVRLRHVPFTPERVRAALAATR